MSIIAYHAEHSTRCVNITSLLVNLAALAIAGLSVRIAGAAFQDAQESGQHLQGMLRDDALRRT
jgi:hypothetical protein